MRKRVAVAVAILVLGASGVAVIVANQPSTPAVQLSFDVKWEGTALVVSGTTSLPDGAIVTVTALEIDPESAVPSQSAVVSNGRYSATVELPPNPAGWVETEFDPSDPAQPPAVVQLFGADGARLRGPGTDHPSDPEGTPRYLTIDVTVPPR